MKNLYAPLLILVAGLFCNTCFASGHGSRDHIGNETQFRDDTWVTNQWTPYDSGSYVRDAQLNPVAYTYFHHTAGWVPVFTSQSVYDANNNLLNSITQYWNAVSSSFGNTYKYIETYNGANKALTQTQQIWANGAWRNSSMSSFVYDGNTNMTQYLIQIWDTVGNTWINQMEYLYTYDASNNQLTNLFLNWNTGTSAWDSSSLAVNTYDGNHHLLTRHNYSNSGGPFAEDSRYTYTYDVNGNRLTEVYQNTNDGIVFNNYSKDDYTYDSNNNMLTDHSSVWNSGNSTWDNFALRTYTYNGINKEISYQQQVWTNGAYVYNGGSTLAYDSYGNLDVQIGLNWDSTSGWYPSYKDSSVFDQGGNELYGLAQNYDTTIHAYVNQSQSLYIFGTPAGINEANGQLKATLYPNPCIGKNISLQLDLEKDASLSINICDITGRLLSTENRLVNSHENLQLYQPDLGTGTYLLQLIDGSTGKSNSTRFIVR